MPEAIPPVGASWGQEATQARQVHLWGQEAIPPVGASWGQEGAFYGQERRR